MRAALVTTALVLLSGCFPARLVAPLRDPGPATPDEAFRAVAPPIGPIAPLSAPPALVTTLPNGLRVVFVARHDIPIVAIRLVSERGAVDLDESLRHEVHQMISLCRNATRTTLGGKLRVAVADTVASWDIVETRDDISFIEKVTRGGFDAALQIAWRAFVQAHFTTADHDLTERQWVQTSAARPISLQVARSVALFGASEAYGDSGWNRQFVSLAAAQALHDRLLSPDRSTLIVVGDVTPEAVDESAARWLGGWRAGEPLPRVTTPPALPTGPRVATVSVQTEQRKEAVFALGPTPGSDDVFVLGVIAQLLEGKSTKLFAALRESGDAYSPNAYVTELRNATLLSAEGSFANHKALDGVRRTLDAIAELRAGHVTDDDLGIARETVLSRWRQRMSTVEGIALAYADGLDRGLDHVGDLPERVGKVTVADIARVAGAYLAPGALHVLLIGNNEWVNTDSLDMGPAAEINIYK